MSQREQVWVTKRAKTNQKNRTQTKGRKIYKHKRRQTETNLKVTGDKYEKQRKEFHF